jgi:hypothetical protein
MLVAGQKRLPNMSVAGAGADVTDGVAGRHWRRVRVGLRISFDLGAVRALTLFLGSGGWYGIEPNSVARLAAAAGHDGGGTPTRQWDVASVCARG